MVADLIYTCQSFVTPEEVVLGDRCDCEIDLLNPVHAEIVDEAIAEVSDRLCLLSAHTVRGICEQTVTVCRSGCSCSGSCTCALFADMILLPGPIVEITSVSWGGYTYLATDFRIVDDTFLAINPDGALSGWPGASEIEIELAFGHPVDQITKNAVIEFVCPIIRRGIKAALSLGQNVGEVRRQGIGATRKQVSFFADLLQQAMSDRPNMALFVATYNATGARQAPFLESPDMDQVHVVRSL